MATRLDEWKVLPRLMMLVTTIMYIRCLEWAMSQPDLSVSQAGLISVVTGAFTGAFGIWMGKESTTTVTSNKIVHELTGKRLWRRVHKIRGKTNTLFYFFRSR